MKKPQMGLLAYFFFTKYTRLENSALIIGSGGRI
jgi:hypothetical protein